MINSPTFQAIQMNFRYMRFMIRDEDSDAIH